MNITKNAVKCFLPVLAAVALNPVSHADPVLIGNIYKASGSDADSEAAYVNFLLDVADSTGVYTQTYGAGKIRYYTVTNAGDYDVDVDNVDTIGGLTGTTVSGWDFIVGKYNNKDFVWFVDGDEFTIPSNASSLGWNTALTSWRAFETHVEPTLQVVENVVTVPDAASSITLMAMGLTGLFMARRRASK